MKCLLAIGISSSDEELNMKESQHQCKSEAGKGDSLQTLAAAPKLPASNQRFAQGICGRSRIPETPAEGE